MRPGHLLLLLLLSLSAASLDARPHRGAHRPKGGSHNPKIGAHSPKSGPHSPKSGPHGDPRKVNALKALCAKTDYPAVCERAAAAYPALVPAATPGALLDAHVALASDSTKGALAQARTLMGRSPNRIVKGILSTCVEQYQDALDDLKGGARAAAARDFGTANSDLSAVITYYATCDEGFEERMLPNQLKSVDDQLTQMVSNSLVFVQMML